MQKAIHYKKTKSIGQDLDVLSKNQTGSHTHNHNNSPADMSASTKNVVWLTTLFLNSKHVFV